jgi:nuclear-control-of-ATPase protein 2
MDTTPPKDHGLPPKGPQSWLRDISGKGNPLLRTSSSSTLPVFFDRDGRVGPTALWLKEPHVLAALSSDGNVEEAKEAELARAAQAALEIAQVRGERSRKIIPRFLICVVVQSTRLNTLAHSASQAASRELLNDLHHVTRSLGFWDTKLHDTSRGLWWFMLLRTGPAHFFGEVLKWGCDIVSVCTSTFSGSKTGKLDHIRTQKRKTSSPIFQIDAKVRALSAMQFGLATAVGEVHRNAGVVAAAWGTSAEKFDNESLRSMLSDSLHDLLGSLEGVSASKATLPSGASQEALHEAHSGKVPQSPLSKAVNTEFTARKSTRKQHEEYRTPSPVFMKTPEASSASGSLAEEGFADVWRLVNLLKDEGTKASLSAKKILAAHTMPEKWQRRWVLYGALASAVGEFH